MMGHSHVNKYKGGMPMLKELISEKRANLSSVYTHMLQSTNESPVTMYHDYDNNYNHSSIQIGGGSFITKNSNKDGYSRRHASVKNSVSNMYGSDLDQSDDLYQGLWNNLR